MVDIVSGDEFKAGVKKAQAEFRKEVFNSGIPRLPVLLNFPITYLHTF